MSQAELIALAEELLDALLDTVELAGRQESLDWQAHLEYLRALERHGQELFATFESDLARR